MKKLLIIAALLILVAIVVFLFVMSSTKTYPLICHEKVTGKLLTINDSCSSAVDCQEIISNRCGPENSCNNVRLECQSGKCVNVDYFRFDKTCV